MKREKENESMNFIERIMEELIAEIGGMPNEAYLSESDFQFEFANKAKALGAERVTIELPFKHGEKDTRKRVDIFFVYEGVEYYLELKYKTTLFKEVTRYGVKPGLALAKQSAENDSMFAFRKDIERMEKLLASKKDKAVKAYCVFLSNYNGFWESHKGPEISKIQLNDKIKAGKLEYKDKSVDIANEYTLVWKDFKKLGDTQMMKYLIVECKPGVKDNK